MTETSDETTTLNSGRDLRHFKSNQEPSPVSGHGQLAPPPALNGGLDARALVAADAVGLFLAFAVAQITVGRNDGGQLNIMQESILVAATLPGWLFVAQLYGLYSRDRRRCDHSTWDELVPIFHLTTIGTWLLVLLFWSTGSANPDFAKIAIFWLAATLLVPGARSAVRVVLPRIRQTRQNVVIVGAGEAGQIVAMKVLAHDEYGLRLVCFVDADPMRLAPELVDVPVISTLAAFWELTRRMHVDRVILSYSRQRDEDQLDLVHSLRTRGIHVDIVPRMFELLGEQAELHNVEAFRLLGLPPISSPSQSSAKRVFDVVISSLLLLLLSPAFVVAALLVKLDSKGPTLFRSERIGADGQRFTMMKFRTMRDRAEQELDTLFEDTQACAEFQRAHKLHNDPRVTRTGSWLRRTSLDELPQLFDVLRGRLSLVGPRPITVAEYENFGSGQDGNGSWTDVSGYWDIPGLQPGLTGLWQVNGRSAIAYAERVRLDKIYVSNWSFWLDLLILAKTFRTIVTGAGAT